MEITNFKIFNGNAEYSMNMLKDIAQNAFSLDQASRQDNKRMGAESISTRDIQGLMGLYGLYGVSVPKTVATVYDLTQEEMLLEYYQIQAESETWDFSDMSDMEIYDALYCRFIKSFGNDFLAVGSQATLGFSTPNMPANLFDMMLQRSVSGEIADVYRQINNCSGMSDEEIIAAEWAKYPEHMSLQDRLMMEYNLKRMDVPFKNTAWSIADHTMSLLTRQWRRQTTESRDVSAFNLRLSELWRRLITLPADETAMEAHINNFKNNDNTLIITDDIFSVLDMFGARKYIADNELAVLFRRLFA